MKPIHTETGSLADIAAGQQAAINNGYVCTIHRTADPAIYEARIWGKCR